MAKVFAAKRLGGSPSGQGGYVEDSRKGLQSKSLGTLAAMLDTLQVNVFTWALPRDAAETLLGFALSPNLAKCCPLAAQRFK